MLAPRLVLATAVIVAVALAPGARATSVDDYRDGHARPRALAVDAADGRVYAALSTADALAVVDPGAGEVAPRVVARVPVCRFPDALVSLPSGGVLVACRFEPALRRVTRGPRGDYHVALVPAGDEASARGLALSPDGAFAYVASPASAGVKVVSLAGKGVVQTLTTGLSPRTMLVVPAGTIAGESRPLLLVSSFLDRKVTMHPITADGHLDPAAQTIATEAPALDLAIVRGELWLATHEDRPISRPTGAVEGLDSGVLVFPARRTSSGPLFEDAGEGHRAFVNLSERAAPVVEPAAIAVGSGTIAIAGAGSDGLLVAQPNATALVKTPAIPVGAAPAAVASLPDGRWVTADRLSDTLTFVGAGPHAIASVDVGAPARTSRADLGELMFFSRALVPNNVSTGALSLYTCAACHDDAHTDGRRHPSKRNRFFSMTKTCRGLGATPPYLSLGEPDTIEAFADNIVATHAQGAERAPETYDRYPVTLRVRAAGDDAKGQGAWRDVTLSPDEVRAALAAYMASIPTEPSPFVRAGQSALSPDERRGLAVFRSRCASCHELVGDTKTSTLVPARALERRLLAGEVALTSARLYDVGTPVLGKTGNNPPSLRGVWDAAPYFSDGSARSLEEVLARTDPAAEKVHASENASRPPAFTPADRAALVKFLRAL
ncbi:MAG TPA: c-type cytochrome [Polyangia bacterium]|nr:c-type cytochrome [Polyangia bacterium]